MKIGPVDTEMALLIVKKEEITEGKIHSPIGRFAERAKQGSLPNIRCFSNDDFRLNMTEHGHTDHATLCTIAYLHSHVPECILPEN